MKILCCATVVSLLFAGVALAQSAPQGQVPPPPGMNDPGVQAQPPAGVSPSAAPAATHALPSMQSPAPADGKKHMSLPDVTTREESGKQVQEYRRNGQIYRIVVTPKHGVPYSYSVDPDGALHREAGQPPVRPVMYKVLEWGKPARPAEADSSAPPPAAGG